ncbi:MAG: bphD [Ignavibacteria bacterium]|nr:bphD [Ignavibacteria bacterium]
MNLKTIIKDKNQELSVIYSGNSGQPIFFIHGNSLSSYSFRKQLNSSLNEKYQLLAIDLPGHGSSVHSTTPESDYTMLGMQSAVLDVINELHLENVVLVGHSLGGHIALEISQHVKSLAGLLIFGTPPLNLPPAIEDMFHINAALGILYNGEWTREETELYASIMVENKECIDEDFLNEITKTDKMFRPTFGNSMMTGYFKNEMEIINSTTKPICIIHGEKDANVKTTYFPTLKIPTLWRNKVHYFGNTGHSPQWEKPNEFNIILDEFIKEII